MSSQFFGAGEFWSVHLNVDHFKILRRNNYRKCINWIWVNPYPVSVWSLITRSFNHGSGIAALIYKWSQLLFLRRRRCFCCYCYFKFFPISYLLCVYLWSALHHAESLSQFEWWADRNTDIFESNNNFSVAQWRTYKIFASFRIQDILSVVWCFLLISNSFCSHSVWPVYLVDAHLFWNVSDCICAINVLFVVEHRIYHLMIISNTKILFL